MTLPRQSTFILTHFGRRSGKAFTVKIWYADIDGELWIGSLDRNRNWVKNVESGGRALVDFGKGMAEARFEPVTDPASMARYRSAIARKYPIFSRLIGLFVRNGQPAVFRARSLG